MKSLVPKYLTGGDDITDEMICQFPALVNSVSPKVCFYGPRWPMQDVLLKCAMVNDCVNRPMDEPVNIFVFAVSDRAFAQFENVYSKAIQLRTHSVHPRPPKRLTCVMCLGGQGTSVMSLRGHGTCWLYIDSNWVYAKEGPSLLQESIYKLAPRVEVLRVALDKPVVDYDPRKLLFEEIELVRTCKSDLEVVGESLSK